MVALGSTLTEKALDIGQDLRTLRIVEFQYPTNQNTLGISTVHISLRLSFRGSPAGPSRQCHEVQPVEFGELQENNRIRLLDEAPFDLRQIRVRPPDPSLDFAQ